MENNFSLKMYLETYKKEIEELKRKAEENGIVFDLDERISRLEAEIKAAESKINSMEGMTTKEFEQKSKPYMELIKNNEKEIAARKLEKEDRKKNPEKDINLVKKNLVKKAKEAAENAVNEAVEKAEKDFEAEKIVLKNELKGLKQERKDLKEELKNINEEEALEAKKVLEAKDFGKKRMVKVKDSKYKEFLSNKIKALEVEIKNFNSTKVKAKEEETEQRKLFIEDERRKFLKNLGKVDRNEELIPMAVDIAEQKRIEKQKREERKQQPARPEQEPVKVEQENAKPEQEPAKVEQENEKPEQEPAKVEQEDTKTEQEKDENAEDILGVYDSSDVTGELPDDIEITLGRKGSIVYDGEKYRIPRKALRNVDDLGWKDMFELIKKTGMIIENEKLLNEVLKIESVDYAVINGICNAKKMENGDKAIILNNYFKDCFKSLNGKDGINLCNVNYNLNDLSKTSLMTLMSKYAFVQRAERAEKFNVGHRIGKFEPKPTLFAKLIGRIRGENLKELAENNKSRTDNENVAKNKAKTNSFLKGLEVEKTTGFRKDNGEVELDSAQSPETRSGSETEQTDEGR